MKKLILALIAASLLLGACVTTDDGHSAKTDLLKSPCACGETNRDIKNG